MGSASVLNLRTPVISSRAGHNGLSHFSHRALRLDIDNPEISQNVFHNNVLPRLPFPLMRGIGQANLAKDVDWPEVAALLDGELVG